jgi:hypothetical protein
MLAKQSAQCTIRTEVGRLLMEMMPRSNKTTTARAHDVTSLGDQHQDHRTRNGNDQRRFNLPERLRDKQGAEPQNSASDWPEENEIHSCQPRVGTAIENDGSGPGKPQDQRGTKKQEGTESRHSYPDRHAIQLFLRGDGFTRAVDGLYM